MLKELLFEAKKMGLTLDFDLVDMNIAYSSSIDEKFSTPESCAPINL